MTIGGKISYLRHIRGSLIGAAVVLFIGAPSGDFLLSLFVCPLWFLVSLVKNAIHRHGWRVALSRIAVPAVTLGLVLTLAGYQSSITRRNAEQIVYACEQFRAAHGRYPNTLGELIPQYLASLPPAKYGIVDRGFSYSALEGSHKLWWFTPAGFGIRFYDFERGEWGDRSD